MYIYTEWTFEWALGIIIEYKFRFSSEQPSSSKLRSTAQLKGSVPGSMWDCTKQSTYPGAFAYSTLPKSNRIGGSAARTEDTIDLLRPQCNTALISLHIHTCPMKEYWQLIFIAGQWFRIIKITLRTGFGNVPLCWNVLYYVDHPM